MMPVLRPITAADNPALARIIRDALTEYGAAKPGTVYYDPTTDFLFELFRQPGSCYFVAETAAGTGNATRLQGGAGIFPTPGLPPGCCELVKLYLRREARGQGLGARLIQHCLEAATALNYRQVYLETLPELHQAIHLYQSFGFRQLDGPLGDSGHFGCDLWMLKDLDSPQPASSTS